MKRILFVVLSLLCCLAVLAACEQSVGNVEITTAKAGKVQVSLYDQTLPADKMEKSMQLTPLVGANDKSITDDGKGLYRIVTRTEGEGTMSLSTDKATAGTIVSFSATPAANWRFVSVSVNGEIVQNNGTSFVMPDQDATVVATFADMRHVVIVGDHIVAENWGELRDDYYLTTAYTLVAGQRYEFTVDYQEENHYYEDKDVTCHSTDGAEIAVAKIGNGRYAFVAPDSDCYLTVTTHEYRHIDAVKVYTSSYDWGIYSEQDYTDYFTVKITADGRPYTFGESVKDGATVKLTLSSKLAYTVEEILSDSYIVTYERFGNTNQFTFFLDFSAQSLRIRIELSEQPFTVTCAQAEHGNVSCDKANAFAGDTVNITATPAEGYELYLLRYTIDDSDYTVIEKSGGVYSFVMPDSDVTITAMFVSNNAIACSVRAYDINDDQYVDLTDAIASLEYAGRSYPVTDGLLLFFDESLIGQTVEIKVTLDSHCVIYKVQYVDGDGNHYGEIGRYEWGDGTISLYLGVQEEDYTIVLRVYA